MVLQHGPIIRSPFGRVPLPGTVQGDQLRDWFEHGVLSIMGDTRLFWLPRPSETTTSTDRSKNARTFTENATMAGRFATLGSGVSVSYNGTSDLATVPDNADFSFGDGTYDGPMSIVSWVNPTIEATNRVILCKDDYTTGTTFREWTFQIDSNNYATFYVHDNSAAARLGRQFQTALVTGWQMLVSTYDGSRASTGLKVYRNAARVDNGNDNAGTYVAMENLGAVVKLGHNTVAAGSAGDYFDGSKSCVVLGAKELSVHEIWALKSLGNAYLDLAL